MAAYLTPNPEVSYPRGTGSSRTTPSETGGHLHMAKPARLTIGLLADFSGGTEQSISERRFITVDRDTLDDAIRVLRPEVRLDLPFCRSLHITRWSDFQPGQIAERVPALKALLYARSEVSDPDAMRRHLDEAGVSSEIAPEVAQDSSSATPPAQATDEGLLDSILDESEPTTRQHLQPDSDFDRMVRAIIEQSGSSTDFAREDARRSAIDEELSRRVRAILHHPDFQSLEASWSAARQIVRAGDETGLQLFDLRLSEVVMDATQPDGQGELSGRMGSRSDPADRASRFSFLLCAMELGSDKEGQRACAHLSGVAADCGASLAIGLRPALTANGGLPSLAWREEIAERSRDNVALVVPRILLRLPYGKETNPVDEFDFEELVGEPEASFYLWGSAAFSLGVALASWNVQRDAFGEINGLPIHVFRSQGEIRSTGPVAELLSESRTKELNDAGFTCIVGIVGGDSAQVVGFRSLLGRRILDA